VRRAVRRPVQQAGALRPAGLRHAASRARAVVLVASAVALGGIVACGERFPTCYEGDHRACTCGGASEGYQACLPAEDAYGPCVCDGVTPGADASALADAGDPPPSGKRGFLEPCATNEDCEGGLCHDFPAKGGLLCSQACDDLIPCPPPSTGCNHKGVCKAP
jgi:hypothetical protein